jgi:hypothetical protein
MVIGAFAPSPQQLLSLNRQALSRDLAERCDFAPRAGAPMPFGAEPA